MTDAMDDPNVPPTQPSSTPGISDPPGFVDAFYAETYADIDHISRPHLKPRGRRVFGPFRTYQSAQWRAEQIVPCTHYSVLKYRVRESADLEWQDPIATSGN